MNEQCFFQSAFSSTNPLCDSSELVASQTESQKLEFSHTFTCTSLSKRPTQQRPSYLERIVEKSSKFEERNFTTCAHSNTVTLFARSSPTTPLGSKAEGRPSHGTPQELPAEDRRAAAVRAGVRRHGDGRQGSRLRRVCPRNAAVPLQRGLALRSPRGEGGHAEARGELIV